MKDRSARHLRKDRYSEWDFSAYQLDTTLLDGVRIDRVHKNSSMCGSVTFINARGILAVTGDFGNWIFCREFHPAASNYVSQGYWLEKMETCSSGQCGMEYDRDATHKQVEEIMDGRYEGFDLESDPLTEEEKEYLEECLDASTGDDWYYEYIAHSENVGRFEDHDLVPLVKKLKAQLSCVFDAFNRACDIVEDMEEK